MKTLPKKGMLCLLKEPYGFVKCVRYYPSTKKVYCEKTGKNDFITIDLVDFLDNLIESQMTEPKKVQKEKRTNKGIAKRDAKLKKNSIKRNAVKPEQENLCRFARLKNKTTDIIHGKRAFCGFKKINGLQIENKLYYAENGKLRYVFVNKHGNKITKTYPEIPEWADPLLVEKYNNYISKQS